VGGRVLYLKDGRLTGESRFAAEMDPAEAADRGASL
jgi:hypothetical protein